MNKETVLVPRIDWPKEKGYYITNVGRATYFPETENWIGNMGAVFPDYWYQEISLSSLLEGMIPTEDEIKYKGVWDPQEVTSRVRGNMDFQMAEKMLKTWAYETVVETLKSKFKLK